MFYLVAILPKVWYKNTLKNQFDIVEIIRFSCLLRFRNNALTNVPAVFTNIHFIDDIDIRPGIQ